MEHPYGTLLFLKNKDPTNYVLYKDFFFYCIIGLYLFLVWYYIDVYRNYEFLTQTDEGGLVWYFSLISSISIFLSFLMKIFNKQKNFYPLLGLGFILLLTSFGILMFNFSVNEVEKGYENDPLQISYTFLLLYSFVSFFIC